MVARQGVLALFMWTLPVAMAAPLQAQSVGDRIRVSVMDTTHVGSVTDVSDLGFEFMQGDVLRSFSYATIDRLERSVGTRRMWKEGFLVGLTLPPMIAGAVIVGCFGSLVDADMGGPAGVLMGIFCIGLSGVAVVVAIPAAAVGAVVGAGIGSFIKRDVWERISIDGTTEFSPLGAPRFGPERRTGLELGVRLRIW